MHIGRNYHLLVSVVSGFTASFVTFTVAKYAEVSTGLRGQLMAGDPTTNKQLPSTLNAMKGAMEGSDSIMNSFASYGFWMTVSLGGIVASLVAFKMFRRYV
jgi:hypothetical protein